MKKIITLLLASFILSSCAYSGKYVRTNHDRVFLAVLKHKEVTDTRISTLSINSSKGILFDSLETSYNILLGSTPLASANLNDTKRAFNKLAKLDKEVSIAVFGAGQNMTRLMLKKALQGNEKNYQNIHLIYVGLKEYSDEIKEAAEARGMKYSFIDIEEISIKNKADI